MQAIRRFIVELGQDIHDGIASAREVYRERQRYPGRDRHLLERGGLVTTGELAAFLRKAPGTLDYWAGRGYGPRFTRADDGERLYDTADVRAWLSGQTASPSAPRTGLCR
jgi:hypothetical protein